MGGVLFDTSVYIDALCSTDRAVLNARRLAGAGAVWLSAVVLEELYAGAMGENVRLVQELEYDFEKAERILAPTLNDWILAGKALRYLRSEYGYEAVGRSRLANDALVAMSAGRNGIVIITENAKDFARLSKFRPFAWQLAQP